MMVSTPSREAGNSDAFRSYLEASYHKPGIIHLAAGSQVPMLRQSLWLVVRGMVKLGAISIHGDEMLLGLVGPNEPFGDLLMGVEASEARTLCPTDLLCLSLSDIQADPALASGLIHALAQRTRQAPTLLALMGLRRVEERVRGFLELVASDYGQPCEKGLRLTPRLTHQEMASALATTRVTVTRVIGNLRQEGWLSTDDQRQLVISHLPRR